MQLHLTYALHPLATRWPANVHVIYVRVPQSLYELENNFGDIEFYVIMDVSYCFNTLVDLLWIVEYPLFNLISWNPHRLSCSSCMISTMRVHSYTLPPILKTCIFFCISVYWKGV